MMKRETLNGYRRVVRKFSYYPSAQQEQNLIDSHLEALDRIDVLEAKLKDVTAELADARWALDYERRPW
jgi:hypothetical protein